MPIRFVCSSCGRTLSTARRKAGSFIACPACRGTVLVEPIAVEDPLAFGEGDSIEFTLPQVKVGQQQREEKSGPRVFMDHVLRSDDSTQGSSRRVRLIAWLIAALVLLAVGVALYLRFIPAQP
jgi:DNA-directed RNA polymerase subunit RPC12/RpoP